MTRRIAGNPFPGRERLALAVAREAMTEQALRNFIALSPFSGRAWVDRFHERPRRPLPIPLQRQSDRLYRDRMARIAPQGVPNARRR